jgi:MraZ protein
MFRGQFVHSVDAKGRVSLPARFRDALLAEGDARCVLTPAPFDPCLHLHPMRAWLELEQRISELPRFDANIVRFRRLYISAALECELDRSGRVLVPPHLRERTGLDKEAVWAGMGRTIELWDKTRWEQAISMGPDERKALEQVMEQI